MQIVTDQHQKETKQHGTHDFPFLISHETLSAYESGSFLWHWHPEIELTYIVSGEMLYRVNGDTLHLAAGQALFVNSGCLHSASMYGHCDCRYIPVTFDARLIYGYENSLLYSKYVRPLLKNPGLAALHFNGTQSWHAEAIEFARQLAYMDTCAANPHTPDICTTDSHTSDTRTANSHTPGSCTTEPAMPDISTTDSHTPNTTAEPVTPDARELDIELLLLRFWRLLFLHSDSLPERQSVRDDRSYERIRTILSFIEEHYASRLTLDDISASIHLCRAECCRLFHAYMGLSLFAFLQQYRVEKSLPLLADPDRSITEIAGLVGFPDSNYFAKVFRRQKGCSPTEYRRG